MKTPEEIKKGLECCSNINADCKGECPYFMVEGCLKQCKDDSLAYIQRLEHERDVLLKELSYNCGKCKHIQGDPRKEPCASCKVLFDSREQLSVKSNFEWEGLSEEDD